jgi:6-phosphogluconolactonase (cycloisomerase 2 family)
MNKSIIYVLSLIVLLFSCNGKKNRKETSDKDQQVAIQIPQTGEMYLLVGTYTSDEGSKGIYVYRFNTETGESEEVSVTEVANPSYLTLSPNEKFVYSVGENDEGDGAAYAFSFDKKTGRLVPINSQSTQSAGPCYITIDKKGKNVHTANYGGGSISSFQVKSDGGLSELVSLIRFKGSGPDTVRQKSPHVHCVRYSPDGKYLFATDLGTDKIYRMEAMEAVFEGQPAISESTLIAFVTPPGTGPRHFDFHPGEEYVYLLGELSGEVIVYDYNDGYLKIKQTIASDTVGARGSADIHVSPDGRFLYTSNRLKADGIAIFSINPDDGKLKKVGYQLTARHPRNFAITPNGKFLLVASRDDNKIQVFAINSETGLLTDTSQDILLNKPVCLKFASMEQ